MVLFGKSLSEYTRFQSVLLIVTAAVGIVRLALSMLGAPDSLVTWFSMTGLLLVGAVYHPIRVQLSGFGGYKQVLILIGTQVLVSQLITAVGIFAAPLTGIDNIYSAAGADAGQLGHAAVHIGIWPIMSLFLWIPASLILLIARRVLRST